MKPSTSMRSCVSRRGTIPTSRIWSRIHASPSCCIRIPARKLILRKATSRTSLRNQPCGVSSMQSKTVECPPSDKSARERGLRVVAIGGGTGLSTLLKGLKKFVGTPETLLSTSPEAPVIRDLCAVVTVSDDGGSSGRLRKEFNMLPPGDIRNCIVALSEDEALLSKLFRHRFDKGSG